MMVFRTPPNQYAGFHQLPDIAPPYIGSDRPPPPPLHQFDQLALQHQQLQPLQQQQPLDQLSGAPLSPVTGSQIAQSQSPRKQKSVYFNNVASIVCLLWFNDMPSLSRLFDEAQAMNSYVRAKDMSKYSVPSPAFKQFIMNVITRTQLPPTAVSLALLYILKLKQQSPSPIIGSANSEYRVFSVAMILANKFLDDNTYTNKTWADITRLPLKELSAMEIEFLANMKYSLFVDQAEWKMWQLHLKVWLNVHYSVVASLMAPQPFIPPTMAMAKPYNNALLSPPQSVTYMYPVPAMAPLAQTQSMAPPFATVTAPEAVNVMNPMAGGIPVDSPPVMIPTPGITPTMNRKRTFSGGSFSDDAQYSHNKRVAVQRQIGLPSPAYMYDRPVRTLVQNTAMPTNSAQPVHTAPIYYVVSQKKTFSPHYGFLPSTNRSTLLPQQYQFELQHYTPDYHHMNAVRQQRQHPLSKVVSGSGAPIPQFLSPGAPGSYLRPYKSQHFSSPPHYNVQGYYD